MCSNPRPVMVAGVLLCVFLATVLSVKAQVLQGVPHLISYQGRLSDNAGNPVADGQYLIQFTIWSDPVSLEATHHVWSSGFRPVDVVAGNFAYMLGSSVPIPGDLFSSDTVRWLGIEVGGDDPELQPRTRLVTTPYAFHALRADSAKIIADAPYVLLEGGEMTGPLAVPEIVLGSIGSESGELYGYISSGQSPTLRFGQWSNSHYVAIQDADNGFKLATMEQDLDGGGMLTVRRDNNDQIGVTIEGNSSASNEPAITMTGANGFAAIDLSYSGDSSVVFPVDAISAIETVDEPGIAATHGGGATFVQGPNDMVDIETITITTPAAGYIVVRADAVGRTYNCADSWNYAETQIDETPGGSYDYAHRHWWGVVAYENRLYHHLTHTRVYYKAAGTYTFRLEGRAFSANCPESVTEVTDAWMLATFYPTSYGAVETITSYPGDHPTAATVSIEDNDNNVVTAHKVDLRYYELKAAAARKAAVEAERALAEARLGMTSY